MVDYMESWILSAEAVSPAPVCRIAAPNFDEHTCAHTRARTDTLTPARNSRRGAAIVGRRRQDFVRILCNSTVDPNVWPSTPSEPKVTVTSETTWRKPASKKISRIKCRVQRSLWKTKDLVRGVQDGKKARVARNEKQTTAPQQNSNNKKHERTTMAAGQEDTDLDDLISKNSNGTGDSVETPPLNLDHLTKGQIDVTPRVSRSPGVCSLVSAHCNYLCFAYPRTCSCLTIVGIGLFMFFVLGSMINPTERFGVIDESHLQVEHLDTSKIDHWCLKGDNDSCRCDDPLEGISRAEFKPWKRAHQVNKESIDSYLDSEMLDVAFLGESLVEQMDGRWMGRTPGGVLGKIEKIFVQNFDRTKSGIEGIALGVAGDAVSELNVLCLLYCMAWHSMACYGMHCFSLLFF